MSAVLQTLRDSRERFWEQMKAIADKATAENRTFSVEEQSAWKLLNKELDNHDKRIKDVIDHEARQKEADAAFDGLASRAMGGRGSSGQSDISKQFRAHVLDRSTKPLVIRNPEPRSFSPALEYRDLLTTTGTGLVPTSFFGRILRHMVESSAILSAGAFVLQTDSGEPMRIGKSTAFSTAAIVAEAGVIPESDPTLGVVTLGAFKYGFLVQVSYELAEDNTFDLEAFLAEQCGVAIGNKFGADAINGTGSGQPRGVILDATLGVTGPTGTATSLGTHTTAGQGGDLLHDLQGSLAEPYSRSRAAAFLMRTASLQIVRKLRDSTGQYVFDVTPPPGTGAAGTVLGRPVYLDPNVPAMAANAKSILYGAWDRYWVRQVNDLRFQASDDYAFNQDLRTYRCLARLDGSLIDTTGAIKWFANSAT